MANVYTVQVEVDGPRNTIVKLDGILDTSDIATPVVLVNPALLCGIDNTLTQKAQTFRVMRMNYTVEDGIFLGLDWDAPTPTRLAQLAGRGQMEYRDFGGLVNPAPTGATGNITFYTTGYTSGKVSFTLVLELIKQQYLTKTN